MEESAKNNVQPPGRGGHERQDGCSAWTTVN